MPEIANHIVILIASLITLAFTALMGVVQYKKERDIDRRYEQDVKEYKDVTQKLLSHDRKLEYLEKELSINRKDDLAKMRITLVRELKRCIHQQHRTIIDIESIDPLLDIYFDENHKGNGAVKTLSRLYNDLPTELEDFLNI